MKFKTLIACFAMILIKSNAQTSTENSAVKGFVSGTVVAEKNISKINTGIQMYVDTDNMSIPTLLAYLTTLGFLAAASLQRRKPSGEASTSPGVNELSLSGEGCATELLLIIGISKPYENCTCCSKSQS